MTDTVATWRTSLQSGEYALARARAAAHGEDPQLVAALDDLDGLSSALRAKNHAVARRMLGRYQDSARESGLDLHVQVGGLDEALGALEAAERPERPAEPEALQALLAPALSHPLTAAEAHNALGVLHALREEPEAARAAFEAALSLDGGHYRALTNVGNLLLEAGDLDGAETRYRRALELNKEYPGAHHNLAVVLRKRRRIGESVRALKQSQRLQLRQSRQQSQDEFKGSMSRLRLNPRTVQIVVGVALALVLFMVLRGFHG